MKTKLIKKEFTNLIETLTPKQSKFFALWLQNGNGTESAKVVYDCKDNTTAAAIASENLRKLKFPVKTFLESNGVSLGYLTTILFEATKATKRDQFSGEVSADHKTRIDAVDRLSKWLEVEPTKDETEGLKRRIVAEEFFDKE